MIVMDVDTLARGVGLGRVAIGLAILAAPGLAARTWTGADPEGRGVTMLARGLGARDALIGLGTILAARQGQGQGTAGTGAGQAHPLRLWLRIGAASDTADALVTLRNYARLPHPHRVLVAGLASAAAVGSIALAARVGDQS